MTVLVTGGAGYIGSVTADLLHARGEQVVIADDLVRGHRAAVPAGVPLEVGDLTDRGFVAGLAARHRVEAILHFAAWSQVGESMRSPGSYFRNNSTGVLNLLDEFAPKGVRFVLSSTAAVYGDPTSVPISEDAPLEPTNPYGESKRICERMLRWYGEAHPVRWVSLRYFNAAGATARLGEDHEPETHLIPLALRALGGRGAPLQVFGTDYPTPDGTCIRDYVHVSDLAHAHVLALDRLETATGEVFNLGNGQGFSVLEVIRAIEAVAEERVVWSSGPRRAGDPPRLVASSERARSLLGWRPRHDEISTIVRTAWEWHRAHPRGYGADPSTHAAE